MEELNQHLLYECITYGRHVMAGREQSVAELFEQEREYLLCLPQTPYSNKLTVPGKVDHYSTVIVDKNRYSVPIQHAGFKVQAVLECRPSLDFS